MRDGEKKEVFPRIIIKSGGKRKIFIFTSLLILRELAIRAVIGVSVGEAHYYRKTFNISYSRNYGLSTQILMSTV